jgi:hypothetical protein
MPYVLNVYLLRKMWYEKHWCVYTEVDSKADTRVGNAVNVVVMSVLVLVQKGSC